MIFYLTVGEEPSGVFRSQVEDVVNYIKNSVCDEIRLISFVSVRNFYKSRKIIRNNVPAAIVLPMVPGLRNWQWNWVLLFILTSIMRPRTIVARGVLACQLAIRTRNKGLCKSVVYDGRGAVAAEWNEYDVVSDKKLLRSVYELEKNSVIRSDRRIAVSEKLVVYWKRTFDFREDNVHVIPCTLTNDFSTSVVSEEELATARRMSGIPENAVVLVYSGSLAGWQSTDLLLTALTEMFDRQPNLFLVLLCEKSAFSARLSDKFPLRVLQMFVPPATVSHILSLCDYGLLIREESITNEVASPVKFAEYIASGLKVIISRGVGDYSQMVENCGLGYVYDQMPATLNRLNTEARRKNVAYAKSKFSKEVYKDVYKKIFVTN